MIGRLLANFQIQNQGGAAERRFTFMAYVVFPGGEGLG